MHGNAQTMNIHLNSVEFLVYSMHAWTMPPTEDQDKKMCLVQAAAHRGKLHAHIEVDDGS
jgi:hypothetical protein